MGDVIHTLLLTAITTVEFLAAMVQEIIRALTAKAVKN